jgi:predicted DNA-binding protein with PD1-like motif
MKYRTVNNGYLIRLEKGEEVVASLTEFAKRKNIPTGYFSGMGAVTDVTLGIFDPFKKEYIKKEFADDLEVGNLTGNIAWLDDTEPYVHCHATVADGSLNASTGHLFRATVTITIELFVYVFEEKLFREMDPKMGFKFWQL